MLPVRDGHYATFGFGKGVEWKFSDHYIKFVSLPGYIKNLEVGWYRLPNQLASMKG